MLILAESLKEPTTGMKERCSGSYSPICEGEQFHVQSGLRGGFMPKETLRYQGTPGGKEADELTL